MSWAGISRRATGTNGAIFSSQRSVARSIGVTLSTGTPQFLSDLNGTVTDFSHAQAVGYSVAGGHIQIEGNAGVNGPVKASWEYPVDAWDKVMAVDLTAVFYCCRTVIPHMRAAGGGRMQRHGKKFGVANPKTVSKEQAATHVGGGAHRVFARLPFEQAVLLTKTS